MLYVAHFSFEDFTDGAGQPWHGHFTCVVEAKDVTAAFAKLRRIIQRTAKSQDGRDVFDQANAIYLNSCVELARVPREGVMSFLSLREGEDRGGISASPLGSRSRRVTAYEGRRPEDAQSAEPTAMEPFVTVRRPDRAPDRATPPVGRRTPAKPAKETVH